MTDANLSTRLPQPRVMPCIVYIYLMIYLFVEQNDLQFASLSGRVTLLSSTTASGSCGAVFLFRASSECQVSSACSSCNSTHKRCQGDHHCSRGFRQMWKMLKTLLNILQIVIRNDKCLCTSFWTFPASRYCLLWNTPAAAWGLIPYVKFLCAQNFSCWNTDWYHRNLFLHFHYSNLDKEKKSLKV